MQYYRCKCGKAESWRSGMEVQDCEGCTECGTTYAQDKDDHQPLAQHDWKPQFDQNTGKPDRPYCRKRHTRGPKPVEA